MLDFSKVLPLVLVIWWTVRSSKRFRRVLFVQAAAVAAIAIASIVNAHTPGGRLQGVLSGMYGNSNDLALAIDIALPLCLALALTARDTWRKAVWAATMLAMIYSVFLTASRAGAIALFVAGLVCLWQLGLKGRRFYLLVLIPITVIVIWLYSASALRQRFGQTAVDLENINSRTEASESAQQRKKLLFKSLRVTAEHPLFGIGPGNFVVVSGVWHVTHNSYTQISAEGGVPAFCLYIFIFWRAVINLGEVRKYGKAGYSSRLFSVALQASLAAYLVGSFFASLAYQLFPYCLVAYTSALRRIVQQDVMAQRRAPKLEATSAPIEVTA
jgi:O-antigen ligase